MNDTNPTNNSGRKSGTENNLVVKDFTRARGAVASQSIRDAQSKTYARTLDQEEVLELLELGVGERGAGGHAGDFDMQTGVALFNGQPIRVSITVSRNPPSERPVALFNVSGRFRNLFLLDWLNPGPPARRPKIPRIGLGDTRKMNIFEVVDQSSAKRYRNASF